MTYTKGNVPWNKGLHWSWNLGLALSPEIRKNMSEGKKRYYLTHSGNNAGKRLGEEWSKHISEGLKRYYSEHDVWNKGRQIHSAATRKRISDSCKRNGVGKWNGGRSHKKIGVVGQDIPI